MLVRCLAVALLVLIPSLAMAQGATTRVTVSVAADINSPDLAPNFLGLSYESSMLLAKDGHYYFDAGDQALVNMFKTLGIKSLRVGANAVDDPRIPIPQEKDIDQLFAFAKTAGVKVIYSFRLKDGAPAESARLAAYIAEHDTDLLDSFSIGNEPNFFLKSYEAFLAAWKPHYEAIVKAVPQAKIEGPSSTNGIYLTQLAKDVFPGGHMSMLTDHYYFLGSGRAAEKNPAASRARFLSNDNTRNYEQAYDKTGKVLAAEHEPYRIDELNSCYNGGAAGSSDTFASALWALDCTHWWAAHHIVGMNYHTGELVGRDGKFGPPNYAAFLHQKDGNGFATRPQGYAYLAFTQGARGRPLKVTTQAEGGLNFNAYAYQDHDNSIYLTLINKSYGDKAETAAVSIQLPEGSGAGSWHHLDLAQKDHDVAAKTDVMLGGSAVDSQGTWSGKWENIDPGSSADVKARVDPASATILRFSPKK